MSTAIVTEADRLQAALSVIPAEDYATWVDMAFAVKSGPGEAGFDVWDDVPDEVRAVAKHRFGVDIRMGTPRENGGPYRGEVFDAGGYLIQEVALRSVVFHARENADFVSERLKWAADHQRLNGTDIQIGYDRNVPKVYPWDRVRDHPGRAVASLKKSARERGLGDDVAQMPDRLQTQSWSRVKEVRRAVLARERARRRGKPGPCRRRPATLTARGSWTLAPARYRDGREPFFRHATGSRIRLRRRRFRSGRHPGQCDRAR